MKSKMFRRMVTIYLLFLKLLVVLKIHEGPFNMKYISTKNPTFIAK